MRRTLSTFAAVAAVTLAAAAPALAESVTVTGEAGGDITEMFVDNARRSVDVNVYGLPGPCETRDVTAFVSWRGDPGQYVARAACYSGTDWAKSLEFLPDGDPQNPVPVECAKFSFKHVGAGDYFKIHIPRSCLVEAPNKIRVRSEAVIFGSAHPGQAGPTKLLARG